MDKNAIKELVSSLGEEKVATDKEIVRLYSKESSGLSGNAIAVLFPESAEEVSRIASIAYRLEIPIYPQGSSSSLSGNAFPSKMGVIVSFERMNKVKSVSVIDSVAIVEPGVRIEELNFMLEEKGYMFPIDPASQSIATIGGAINNGAGGLRGAKYGTMKDWVNGLEVVIPDENGTRLNLGCLTIKCRQGYDLVRLIIGSEGTLALVVGAALRIVPIPEKVVTILSFFNRLEDLLNAFVEIKESGVQPYIAEFMDKKTVELAAKGVDISFSPNGDMLLISIDTTAESSGRVMNWLVDTMKRHNAVEIQTALTQQEAEEKGLFKIRRNLFSAQSRLGRKEGRPSRVFIEDIIVPPSKIPAAVSKLREIGEKYGFVVSLGGHIGDGNIHPSVVYDPEDEEEKKKVYRWFEEVMEVSLELGGSISAEHGIGTMKKGGMKMEFSEKSSEKAIDIMRKIKAVFDPKCILNPGKVFDC